MSILSRYIYIADVWFNNSQACIYRDSCKKNQTTHKKVYTGPFISLTAPNMHSQSHKCGLLKI